MRKTFFMALFCSVLLTALLCTGCNREKPPAEGQATKITAVGSQWYGHIPVWIGIEKGFFAERGFEVTWQFIGKSMDRLNAISSGEAHFASLGEIAMLSAMAQGNRFFYWVGTQDIAPGFEGLVAAKGIDAFDQLKGKSIGFPFGSSVDLTCRMLLQQHGLDPAKDVRLVNLEVGDVPAAFRAGNVDAALIWEPGFSQLVETPGAKVLGMDTDTVAYQKFGTMTGPDVLIIGKAWVDADPARARRFLDAYFAALSWVRDHPDQTVELIQGRYIQQDADLIRRNLAKIAWLDRADQRRIMSDAGLYGQADYVLGILHDDMHTIPEKPAFRQWVNSDILFPRP